MRILLGLFVVALLVGCASEAPEAQAPETEPANESLESIEQELNELDNIDEELSLDEELENLDLSIE